jgi:hypothetical protein
MGRLNSFSHESVLILSTTRISIIVSAVIIVLTILDLLMTRQLLPYDNATEMMMFALTVAIGYGLGSWILLGYTSRISKELRTKSSLIKTMHLMAWIVQFTLFGILSFVLYNELSYGLYANNTRFFTTLAYALSSISASAIMGILSFKFFRWYMISKRNFMLLFFALAASTLSLSISVDAGTKLLMVDVIEEKSPAGAVTKSQFLYENDAKYNGQIQYKVVNPDTTTLFIVPMSVLDLYNNLNLIPITLAFIFRWAGTSTLLYHYYHRIGKLTLMFWIAMFLPLLLYLVGKIPDILSLPSNYPFRFYFRILFRAGTIGGNVIFGLAFFILGRNIVSKNVAVERVKDYLAISAIGITMLIALSVSALQQTYGVAAHSLLLLASYLFTLGLYSIALSISQDSSIRQSIRKSAVELDSIGTAQMEQELKVRITKLILDNQEKMTLQTGISSSLTETDIKEYLEIVIKETGRQKSEKK